MPIVVLAFIGLLIYFRARGLAKWDEARIIDHLRQGGGEFISKEWKPFGKGWLSGGIDRIYLVDYYNEAGQLCEVTIRTSALSGVYYTNDRIIRSPVPEDSLMLEELEDLRDENRHLRLELKRMKEYR